MTDTRLRQLRNRAVDLGVLLSFIDDLEHFHGVPVSDKVHESMDSLNQYRISLVHKVEKYGSW